MTTSFRLCQIVFASASLVCLSQRSLTATARDGALDLAIRPGSEAGGLNVRSPHCPGDVFDFRTCEGVVVGSTDFGPFQVKLRATLGDGIKSWRRDGKVWRYSWPYAQGVTVHIEVEPDGDSLKLKHTLKNISTNALDAVQLHTCIPTTEAPAFFPPPTLRNAQTNWSELYQRLHVWSNGRRSTFAQAKLAPTELHLSLMPQGAVPVRWGWWVNSPETFEPPLIALTSRDGRKTIALAFERAVWASSNTGDDRACFHLFLQDFGQDLARMPACFPDLPPPNLDDPSSLHWSVRWNGSRGFLFFNNHQRLVPLASKENVQFQLQIQSAALRIPRRPIRIASGAHGFWPVNLDCAGVRLDYATAQPLARLEADGAHWFFFTMVEGVTPEFAFAGESPRPCKPGTRIAFTRGTPGAAKVKFVVLTPEQGRQFWKLRLAGRDRVALSPNALLPDDENGLRIETLGDEPVRFAVFPALPTARLNGRQLNKSKQGVFTEYPMPKRAVLKERIEALPVKAGAGRATNAPNAMDESAWADVAVWRITVPAVWQQRDILLRIHFVGDVARLYAGDKLVADKFYNGQPFDFALWRIPPGQLDRLELRVMPLYPQSTARLPAAMRPTPGIAEPRAEATHINALERRQVRLEVHAHAPASIP